MNEYKRLVSYIYAYPGGVREKNVGFAKAEVRGGKFMLQVSLRGVYTDAPEYMDIFFMVEKDLASPGKYSLLPVGNVLVKSGLGLFNGIYNPDNIESSGYTFYDICGIAAAKSDDRFYMLFSMWDDDEVKSDRVVFLPKGYKRSEPEKEAHEPQGGQDAETDDTAIIDVPSGGQNTAESSEAALGRQGEESERNMSDEQGVAGSALSEAANSETISKEQGENGAREESGAQLMAAECAAVAGKEPEQTYQNKENCGYDKSGTDTDMSSDLIERLFENADFINAFDDDYYYDCIEVTPEILKTLPIEDEVIVNNSFLIHGFYNFKHLLFGKVRENENHTKYFIGVPGMYCNRERFMASMFGFDNFKKSHRSDFANPYFGYWYQEF